MLAAISSFVITSVGILVGEYLINLQAWMPDLPELVSNGVIPLILWGAFLFVFGLLIKKHFQATRTEMQLWIFTFLIMAYLVLMFTGIFFRGPAMALVLNY